MRAAVLAALVGCAAHARPPAVVLTKGLDMCRIQNPARDAAWQARVQDLASQLWLLDGPKDEMDYEGVELGQNDEQCPIDIAFRVHIGPNKDDVLDGAASTVTSWRCSAMICIINYKATVR